MAVHAVDLIVVTFLNVRAGARKSVLYLFRVCGCLRRDAVEFSQRALDDCRRPLCFGGDQHGRRVQPADRRPVHHSLRPVDGRRGTGGIRHRLSCSHPRRSSGAGGVAAHDARDINNVATEVLERASDILPAPQVLLIWEEPEESHVNVVWRAGGQAESVRESPGTYSPIVKNRLERENFQGLDVTNPQGAIRLWSRGRFREKRGAPVDGSLRTRFGMSAIQSCMLDGDIVRGRLFWLSQDKMRIEDLVIGELVTRLATARMDTVYFLTRLEDSAGLDERVRLARDLHHVILQTLAGTGLQLAVARRLFEHDPAQTAQRMGDIQLQFERVEVDMRSFIRQLLPSPVEASRRPTDTLEGRLEDLQRHVETQRAIVVEMQLSIADQQLLDKLTEQLFLIVQEAVLNAARHAGASTIRVSIQARNDGLRVAIADDGDGFHSQIPTALRR